MLYTIAAVKGIEALAIMTVSDLLGDDGRRGAHQRRGPQDGRRPDDAHRLPRRRVMITGTPNPARHRTRPPRSPTSEPQRDEASNHRAILLALPLLAAPSRARAGAIDGSSAATRRRPIRRHPTRRIGGQRARIRRSTSTAERSCRRRSTATSSWPTARSASRSRTARSASMPAATRSFGGYTVEGDVLSARRWR